MLDQLDTLAVFWYRPDDLSVARRQRI